MSYVHTLILYIVVVLVRSVVMASECLMPCICHLSIDLLAISDICLLAQSSRLSSRPLLKCQSLLDILAMTDVFYLPHLYLCYQIVIQ